MNLMFWIRSKVFCKTVLAGFALSALVQCAHEGGGASVSQDPFKQVGKKPSVLLLYVSDLHSQLRASTDSLGGYAELAAWIESEKIKAGDKTDVFVIAGGDLFGKGSLPCQITADKDCAPLLKDIGIDYSTLGNYELYNSPRDLENLVRASGIKFVSNNVKLSSGAAHNIWLQGAQNLRGPKSGMSFWLYSWTDPFDIQSHYSIKDSVSTEDWAQLKLQTSGEPLLFLTHKSLARDEKFLKEACQNMAQNNQVLALLKSNDHVVQRKVDGDCSSILEPGPFAQHALKMLLLPKEGQKSFDVHSQFVEIKGVQPHLQIQNKIEALYKKHAPDADELLFKLSAELSKKDLAQWVADAYRVRTRADVAIVNMGYVKDGLVQGDVLKENFFLSLPYTNELMGRDWQISDLEKILCERSRASKENRLDWGSELIISGAKLVNAGTAECRLDGGKKSSVKVVMDAYVVSRSSRWLGRDVSKQMFRFGVDSRRVSLLHLKTQAPEPSATTQL